MYTYIHIYNKVHNDYLIGYNDYPILNNYYITTIIYLIYNKVFHTTRSFYSLDIQLKKTRFFSGFHQLNVLFNLLER